MQSVQSILSGAVGALKAQRAQIDAAIARLELKEVRPRKSFKRTAKQRKAIAKRMRAYWAKKGKARV